MIIIEHRQERNNAQRERESGPNKTIYLLMMNLHCYHNTHPLLYDTALCALRMLMENGCGERSFAVVWLVNHLLLFASHMFNMTHKLFTTNRIREIHIISDNINVRPA